MRGINDYSEEKNPTCSTWDDYVFLDDIGINFSINISAFLQPKCLGMIHEIFSILRLVLSSAFVKITKKKLKYTFYNEL